VSQRIRHSFGSFFARLLLGLLAVSVPVMIVLAVVLTRSAAGTLEESVGESFRLTADESSAQITKWLQERDSDVKILATLMTEPALGADASQDLKHFSDVYGAYAGIQVLDARGRILAGSHSTTRAILPPRSSVRERALRSAEMRTALRVDDAVRVLVSRQFTGAGGARRIVVADLKRAASSRPNRSPAKASEPCSPSTPRGGHSLASRAGCASTGGLRAIRRSSRSAGRW
jgi:hypothetical protein